MSLSFPKFAFLLTLFVSSSANSLELIFQEFDHNKEVWTYKKLSVENHGVPSSLGQSYGTLLSTDDGNMYFHSFGYGVYRVSNEYDESQLVVGARALDEAYGRDFGWIYGSDVRPYINYGDDLLALSSYVNETNTNVIYIYHVVSPDKVKVVYRGQQLGLYYPIRFGGKNNVFFVNRNIIFEVDLASELKTPKYFFKPPSCHRVLDYDFSDNHQVISYTCSDHASENMNIFLFTRETGVLENICSDCVEVEHDLANDGQTLLYVSHKGTSSTLNEFSAITGKDRMLYETESWVAMPVYLNHHAAPLGVRSCNATSVPAAPARCPKRNRVPVGILEQFILLDRPSKCEKGSQQIHFSKWTSPRYLALQMHRAALME